MSQKIIYYLHVSFIICMYYLHVSFACIVYYLYRL